MKPEIANEAEDAKKTPPRPELKRSHSSSNSLEDEPLRKAAKVEKNSLQTLNELMPKLEYNCVQSGPGHQLLFTVTIEIKGKVWFTFFNFYFFSSIC